MANQELAEGQKNQTKLSQELIEVRRDLANQTHIDKMISVKLAKTETELVQEKLHETQAIHQLEDKYTKLQQQSSNHIKELDTKLEITTKKYEGKVTQLNAAKKSAEE